MFPLHHACFRSYYDEPNIFTEVCSGRPPYRLFGCRNKRRLLVVPFVLDTCNRGPRAVGHSGEDGTRTRNPQAASLMLSQLSYIPVIDESLLLFEYETFIVPQAGLEPARPFKDTCF